MQTVQSNNVMQIVKPHFTSLKKADDSAFTAQARYCSILTVTEQDLKIWERKRLSRFAHSRGAI